jgi:hypothetical protein
VSKPLPPEPLAVGLRRGAGGAEQFLQAAGCTLGRFGGGVWFAVVVGGGAVRLRRCGWRRPFQRVAAYSSAPIFTKRASPSAIATGRMLSAIRAVLVWFLDLSKS